MAVKRTNTSQNPGYKTSELWVAVAGAVIPIANQIFKLDIPEEAIYTLIAYVVARSGVKAVEIRRNSN